MKVVIDVGGSIFASPINIGYIKRFSKFLIKLHREGYKLMVVVGGGREAKEYISTAKALGGKAELLDEVGIAITRVNAMLLIAALGGNALHEIPSRVEEAVVRGKILVMGGTMPGQTTDAVAAELASLHGAHLLIVASDVDGVFNKDPRLISGAKLIPKMTTMELLQLASEKKYVPGFSGVIDPLASRIIHRSKIKTVFVNGRNLENMKKVIAGEPFKGTMVIPDG
jgi:uridylate kinase